MAAVVGVIANLFLWFTLNIVFSNIAEKHLGPIKILLPDFTSANITIITIALISAILAYGFKSGLFVILATAASLGLVIGALSS